VLVRNYDLGIRADPEGTGTLERISALGDRVKLLVQLEGVGALIAQAPRERTVTADLVPGTRVLVDVRMARVYRTRGTD
jgi:hypothetical protein